MSNLLHLPEPGQVISHLFDMVNHIKSVCLKDGKRYTRALKNDMAFDPFEVLNFGTSPCIIAFNQRLAVLETGLVDYDPSRIELTDRLLDYLPDPDLDSIKLLFVTARFKDQKLSDFREIRGLFLLHLLVDGRLADVRDGILITFPEKDNGKDFLSKIKPHRPPPPMSKPGQDRKSKTFPPLRVVPDPKPFKPARRSKDRTHKPVLNRFPCLKPGSNKRRLVNRVYKEARTKDIKKDKYSTVKKSHTGLLYSYGNERLVNGLGLSKRTVVTYFKWFCENDIFQQRHDGRPGKGNNIYELVRSESHFKLWKRNRKTRGKHTRKLKPGRK